MAGRSYDQGRPRRSDRDRTRVNHNIRVPEVRLIDEEGNQVGVVSTKDALKMAVDRGLDLVEVASNAKPPVCRIIDYGKYKYEQKQREKAAKRKSSKSTMKELKFRPKIGKHDIDVRVRHARKFLLKGHKVRMIVRFRGREHSHPEIAEELLKGVFKQLEDLGDLESRPKKEGAIMIMNIAPNSQKIQAYKKDKKEEEDEIKEIDDQDEDELEDIDDDDEEDEEDFEDEDKD